MLKLSDLTPFFKRCVEYTKDNKDKIGGPIMSLYKNDDSELLSYLRQDCNKDELYELIKAAIFC